VNAPLPDPDPRPGLRPGASGRELLLAGRRALRALTTVPRPQATGGNRIVLLQGGDALFPRMQEAFAAAEREIWLATYIFHDDPSAQALMAALAEAAARGVAVHVVVDGFGSKATLALLRERLLPAGVQLEVFRPLERWWAWLQPGQLRRLHQKLCACDDRIAFVGGINLIDDRLDLNHGWSEAPRLDFAVALEGPLVPAVRSATRAVWARAHLASSWREELRTVARSAAPVRRILAWMHDMRTRGALPLHEEPVRASFVVRDNLRQRRAIERSYVEAIRRAQHEVDIAVPYFYPGRLFRRALRQAARRGVRVRLLLQGKIDYRIAALAARAVYDELRGHGVRIHEYTPAFLHAKVARVDERWATVGSSNIDPLSLLLNLEANVIVDDADFNRALKGRLDEAFAASREVTEPLRGSGWRGWLGRAAVGWAAALYLRIAGIGGRY
jgi:cardiolipin synthase